MVEGGLDSRRVRAWRQKHNKFIENVTEKGNSVNRRRGIGCGVTGCAVDSGIGAERSPSVKYLLVFHVVKFEFRTFLSTCCLKEQ